MSDGEVLKRGAENIQIYLEEIQRKVREKELPEVKTFSVMTRRDCQSGIVVSNFYCIIL